MSDLKSQVRNLRPISGLPRQIEIVSQNPQRCGRKGHLPSPVTGPNSRADRFSSAANSDSSGMKLPSVDSVETLSLGAMRRLVAGLVGKMDELEADVGALRAENRSLCDNNERLRLENDSLRLDNQLLTRYVVAQLAVATSGTWMKLSLAVACC